MVWFSLRAKMKPPHLILVTSFVYLYKQQRSVEYFLRARNIIKELLPTWKWRLKSITKLFKCDICISFNEQHTFCSTIHHEFPTRPFPKPTCEELGSKTQVFLQVPF
ncbi:hypothetical protein Lalb_Chr03g0037651 [Lupinus albus]|uniref:Uncharacterized protein n=1 Tax=Lupinus albus TaxID=3870 RepID=A0A6A4QSA6_LUPAL|nr:hypothetical protein Lalb_Chr03g0037651 [Lupinus albus]